MIIAASFCPSGEAIPSSSDAPPRRTAVPIPLIAGDMGACAAISCGLGVGLWVAAGAQAQSSITSTSVTGTTAPQVRSPNTL